MDLLTNQTFEDYSFYTLSENKKKTFTNFPSTKILQENLTHANTKYLK